MMMETKLKKKWVICSPFKGNFRENIALARHYCRLISKNFEDVIPIAPHIYFTQFLNDSIPEERVYAMDANIELLSMCQEIWVFGQGNGISEGMEKEISFAKKHNIPLKYGEDIFDWLPEYGIPSITEDIGYHRAHGGNLEAIPSLDENYPGIYIRLRDRGFVQDLALVEQCNDRLRIVAWDKMDKEDPTFMNFQYNVEFLSRCAYDLYRENWKCFNKCSDRSEEELEASGSIYVCYEEFLKGEFRDQQFMQYLLPKPLLALYEQIVNGDL